MRWLSDVAVARLRDVASWPELPEGRYRILGPIGHGGMGRVFLARDQRLDRDVAIKVSNAAAPGSELDERLRREALVLSTLEHPGMAPVHDTGVLDDGRRFYVMKYVKGETLEQHAATLTSESARLAIFERVVEPVAFAHARRVVHRDLKPANVMVGAFGEVLVLDWGVAKTLAGPVTAEPGALEPVDFATAPGATRAGMRLGTPGFMAPEQAQGRPQDVSPATDVYALGALLMWLLGGDGRAVPKRLRAIADRCMEERPGDRYPDAAAVAADLARYRAGLAVDAYRETPWDRLARWMTTYRTFILLIAAYVVLRALVAWWQ
jgi:eukaryotic-like serine/threonine-protein kinase